MMAPNERPNDDAATPANGADANVQPPPASNEPTAPPTQRGEMTKPRSSAGREAFETYQNVVETAGGLSLRLRDNLIQGAFIGVVTVLSAGIGYIFWKGPGALVGAFAGALGSLLLSGVVLGVLGWVRVANRRKK